MLNFYFNFILIFNFNFNYLFIAEGAKMKRSEPPVKDAMTKLKGLFALPSKVTAWDDADVVTTLRRFIIVSPLPFNLIRIFPLVNYYI
jgi:hypothetical protein